MRLEFLFLSLIVAIDFPVSNGIVLADFQLQALLQHNYQRQLHCTPPMASNSTLNTMAQNYANYLAANNIFNHSGTPGYGENLWMISSSGVLGFINGSSPVIDWYNEISMYNYSSPGFSLSTGHFTQVIWLGSNQLGIGIAFTSNNRSAYVVGNYFPPGNYYGMFPANVLPLCVTGSTTATNTSRSSAIITTPMNNRLTTMTVITGLLWTLVLHG